MNIVYYALNKNGEVENRLPRKDDIEALAVISAGEGEHLYAEEKVRETSPMGRCSLLIASPVICLRARRSSS